MYGCLFECRQIGTQTERWPAVACMLMKSRGRRESEERRSRTTKCGDIYCFCDIIGQTPFVDPIKVDHLPRSQSAGRCNPAWGCAHWAAVGQWQRRVRRPHSFLPMFAMPCRRLPLSSWDCEQPIPRLPCHITLLACFLFTLYSSPSTLHCILHHNQVNYLALSTSVRASLVSSLSRCRRIRPRPLSAGPHHSTRIAAEYAAASFALFFALFFYFSSLYFLVVFAFFSQQPPLILFPVRSSRCDIDLARTRACFLGCLQCQHEMLLSFNVPTNPELGWSFLGCSFPGTPFLFLLLLRAPPSRVFHHPCHITSLVACTFRSILSRISF